MMCNTNITSTQATIQIFTLKMTLYGPILLLIIGIFGCLCNLLTFTSRQLRENSCAFYFLCASIFEFLSITFGLISRLAADHFGSDLQNTNRFYCKFRAYLVSSIPLIATYLILLSAIDRCMSSSIHARLRSFSHIKIAHRSLGIAILLGLISCSHILFTYDLRPKCSTLSGSYAIFDGMFVVFWLGIIPHILMLIFGFITLIHIKRMTQKRAKTLQIKPVTTTHHSASQTNRQLVLMMLVQVGLSSLLILTRMIYYAYYILGPSLTGYNRMIGSFLMSFTTLLYYSNYAKSFYIYTLTSRLFRSVFLQRIQECIRMICPFQRLSIKTT